MAANEVAGATPGIGLTEIGLGGGWVDARPGTSWLIGVGLSFTVLGLILLWLARQVQLHAAERGRERRLREELEAYARLETALGLDSHERLPVKTLAMKVCRTVAEKSAFTRVMMLMRNAEDRLQCVGSTGVDDLTVAALERWGAGVMAGQTGVRMRGLDATLTPVVLRRSEAKSLPISLGRWESFDREVATWRMQGKRERRQTRRAIALPIWGGPDAGHGGGPSRLAGAIVVCLDGMNVPLREGNGKVGGQALRADRLMNGLESLVARLGSAIEHEALDNRLLRAEKLAGLGQLAGGVAHALNNPLTAVLGFAELIAESSLDARIQRDAAMIATEALKMKGTIERLTDFWRPSTQAGEPVDFLAMVRELADDCAPKLAERGVALEVMSHGAAAENGAIRGSQERLRQVMEHLLNNAAKAIDAARAREDGEQHAIRVSVSADEQTLHVIVSDTGTGFEQPNRAFDPFYTTGKPGQAGDQGLGLSICYGIVREHGGEIAAFNLHPHGAAVVMELPVREADAEEIFVAESVEGRLRA